MKYKTNGEISFKFCRTFILFLKTWVGYFFFFNSRNLTIFLVMSKFNERLPQAKTQSF